MALPPAPQRLVCPHCGRQAISGLAEKVNHLRRAGHLRRAAEPDPAMVDELFNRLFDQLVCIECGTRGLRLQDVDDSEASWLEARHCQHCGARLARERLELFPDARYCAACQTQFHAASSERQLDEYCAFCGGRLEIVQRSGARTGNYRLVCTSCGRG